MCHPSSRTLSTAKVILVLFCHHCICTVRTDKDPKTQAGRLDTRCLSQQKVVINSWSGFLLCADGDQLPQCLEQTSPANHNIKGAEKVQRHLVGCFFVPRTHRAARFGTWHRFRVMRTSLWRPSHLISLLSLSHCRQANLQTHLSWERSLWVMECSRILVPSTSCLL